MPWQRLAPESTSGRDGFLHPYVMKGGVESAEIRILLRSFVTADLEDHARLLRTVADSVLAEHPGARIDVDVRKPVRTRCASP